MPVLRQLEQAGARPFGEALFLSFNIDVGYFENALLGITQSLGAVATVIGDAAVWDPDTLASRSAGSRYHLGLARTGGAFHPKLALFVGENACLIAIGSGNLTTGGWQRNAELWTVLEGGGERGMPECSPSLADWLDALPGEVTLDRMGSAALHRAAAALRALVERSQRLVAGPRLLHNLSTPILDQLPQGPVGELCLSAPFHDPQSSAVAALVARLRPEKVRIALQPGYTVLDPDALQRALRSVGAGWEAIADAENPGEGGRYRHGKLVEWSEDGSWWSLTGSPNLTAAALMARRERGANCELALLGPTSDPLMPKGRPIDIGTVPRVTIGSAARSGRESQEVRLVGAWRTASAMTVEFARPAPQPCSIESSITAGAITHWQKLGEAPSGACEISIADVPPRGSSWIRASGGEPPHDWASPPVPLTDRESVLRRPLAAPLRRTQRAAPQDFFDDLPLLNELQADLERLAAEVSAAAPLRVPTSPESGESGSANAYRLDTDLDPWFQEIDSAAKDLGAPLAAYALGLPALPDSRDADPGWSELLVEDADPGAEDDESDAAEQDDEDSRGPDGGAGPDHRRDPDRVKQQRRRWAGKAAKTSRRLSLHAQLVLLRLVLALYSAGNWDDDDDEPFGIIDQQLRSLRLRGGSEQTQQRAATLAAVALSVLRDRTDLSEEVPRTLLYRRALESCRGLLGDADDELASEYVRHLRTPYDTPMTGDAVMRTANDLGQNPLSDAAEALTRDGCEVTRNRDRELVVRGTFNSPARVALEAVGLGQNEPPLAVWAVNTEGRWALALWDGIHLCLHEPTRPGPQRWRVWRPTGLLRPSSIAQALRTGDTLAEAPARVGLRRSGDTPAQAADALDVLSMGRPQWPPGAPQ